MTEKNVCQLCRWIKPRKRRICVGENPDGIVFLCGGHYLTKLDLAHLKNVPARFTKFVVWREAYNLHIARHMSRGILKSINQREEQGQDASHLWPLVRQSNAYAKAYAEALDRIGWLGPIERILRSDRFNHHAYQD